MYNQDNVRSMIKILESQIAELNDDLPKVEHFITKHSIRIGIKQLEEALNNAKQKLV